MRGAADQVIEASGFRYRTVGFTWIKRTRRDRGWHFGLGYRTRQNTERCLLAVRGKPRRLSRKVPELIIAPVGAHSVKPGEVNARIEALVDGPYIELFGRQRRAGWDAYRREIDMASARGDGRSNSFPGASL
jgi:N6-adenosine-specific RNA methylase IME4